MDKLKLYTRADIESMEQRYRAQFVNSLPGIKSAFLVGSQSIEGQTNLSIVSSVTHLGSHPPLMSMIMRPNTVPRHTIENIKELNVFTLNLVMLEHYQEAHQTSARYAREVSEFDACGFDVVYEDDFKAPFVAQSQLRIGLKLREIHHLDINGCDFVIGEIVLVRAPDTIIQSDGALDLSALNMACVSGLDRYHSVSKVARLSYAKPDVKPRIVD